MMSSDAASGDVAAFPGAKAQYTETLSFLSPSEYEGIPIYRVMNRLVQPDCTNSSYNQSIDCLSIGHLFETLGEKK